jgi:phenylalanyl-tRNA synthetase alpha chain
LKSLQIFKMPGTRGPVPVPLVQGGRDLTLQILELLDTKEPVQTNDDFPETPQHEIKAALDRLASRAMLTYETQEAEQVVLTSEGQTICNEGSHEYKVWHAVQQKGKLPLKELPVC